MLKKRRMKITNWKSYSGYLFVLPFIFGLAVIFLPALVQSFIFAFHDVEIDFGGITRTFVGLSHVREAFFVDPTFRFVLGFGLFYTVTDSIQILIFSFFIANILNQKFIGRSFARMIFFLPVILSAGFVSEIRDATDALQGGIIGGGGGGAFGQLGTETLLEIQEFLMTIVDNDRISSILGYAIMNTTHVINSSGVQILIFLMALRSINPSLFEASKVEGASKWEEFWKITFPLITPMIFVNFVYTIIATFANPVYGIMQLVRDQAFGSLRIGYASALSWIYALGVLIVLGIFALIFSKRMHYLDK